MAASLTNDLAHMLTEKGVSSELMDMLAATGITNSRLFALMADSRKELKEALAEVPFKLDPTAEGLAGPDKIRVRVSVAQLTDAWISANARVNEKTRVEAEQRAVGVPLALPQGEHVDLKLAYEAKYRRTSMKDYPSDAIVERRLTEIDQGDLRAESLQDVASKDEQADDPQDAVWYQGAFKVKRSVTRVGLPKDSEEFRYWVGLLGITYSVARLRHPGHKWLATATPTLFRDHSDYMLGKKVHKLVIKVSGVEHTPPWALVLSYELEVRKAAIEKICYDGLDIAAALDAVYKDNEHRQLYFLTPCMGAIVAAAAADSSSSGKAMPGASADRPAPYDRPPPSLSRRQQKALKGKGRGKDKNSKGKEGKGGEWHSRTADDKPICFRYNTLGRSCNGKCNMVHCCQRCLGKHPVFECDTDAKRLQ